MFNITLTNKNGHTETFDMGSTEIYYVLEKFRLNEIEESIFSCTMKVARGESPNVRIHSDSDIGNAILRLFSDGETLYDAYKIDVGLSHIRDEFKDELEQNILYEQYQHPEDIFEDVNKMMIEASASHLTFYCPLVGNIQQDDGGYYDEVGNDILVSNADNIESRLLKSQRPEMNLARYVAEHSKLTDKLLLTQWGVEEIAGTLYGKIDCYLSESADPEELERLRKTIRGQNSDGFGEGFEQRDIPVDEGDLYVSFWHYSKDYFLYTKEEMDEYISQQSGMKLGGIQ